jgi:hypothetical protein
MLSAAVMAVVPPRLAPVHSPKELGMGQFDLFRRKPTLAELASDIEQRLLKRIPAAIAKAKPEGQYYCLLLCYCAEDFQAGWPPFLLLGSESERQRIISNGNSVAYHLWAPDEMRNHEANVEIPLHRDQILNDLCIRHAEMMDTKGDTSSAMDVMRRIAKRFNRRDWSELIRVTPDFIVAAVDNTGEVDPARDIETMIPPEKFRSLRRRGLI